MKRIITSLFAIFLISASLQAQFTTGYNVHTGLSQNIGPDLVITSIKVPYVPPGARIYTYNLIQLQVEVTIKNTGNELARHGFGIHTDLKLAGRKKASKTIARLPAGRSQTFRMRITVPEAYNGQYIKLTSTVDPKNLIRELNDHNNTKSVRIKLPRYKKVNRKTI